MNLELRIKACEAVGFVYTPSEFIGHGYEPGFWTWPDDSSTSEELPAIELDPAVSEPIFLAWCAKNNYQWQIDTCDPHGNFTEQHIAVWVHNNEGFEIEAEGSTPSEARANAMATSNKRNQK